MSIKKNLPWLKLFQSKNGSQKKNILNFAQIIM